MSKSIQWRFDLARSISKKISEFDHLHAILIGGSVAKGWADEYSDLEICLCWDKLPSIETRKAIIARFNGKNTNLFSSDASDHPLIFEDGFYIGDFHIDMWNCTNAGIENTIHEVLINYKLNPSMQETLSTIQNGTILKNSDRLQNWRARIKYPHELRIKCVKQHLSVIVRVDFQLHLIRNDIMIYYGLLSGVQKRIIHLLYGLNGVFYQGLKHTKSILQNLKIKPAKCWERFQKVYEVSPIEAAQIMVTIIEEIICLVVENLPELDVSEQKKRLHSKHRVKYEAQ